MTEENTNQTPEKDQLLEELKTTNELLHKQTSYWRVLTLGLVRGVGYAIGATIVAGLVIAFLSATVQSIEDVPVLNKLLPPAELYK